MTRLVLFIAFMSCGQIAWPQRFVDHKVSVQLSFGIPMSVGSREVTKGSYESPSLVNNFSQSYSAAFEVTYKVRRAWSIGFELANVSFQSWDYNGSDRYDDASYSLISLHPKFQMNTPFREVGIWNRVQAFVSAGPAIGLHTVHLGKPTYTPNYGDFDLESSSFVAGGITLSGGARLSLSSRLFLGASIGFSQFWMSSVLFDDTSVGYSMLAAQVGYKMNHNRRFKYAP